MPDNKKYDSETLSQQRKAREEFLELKRMQSDETVSEESVPEKPQTFKEKASNFWYYYRWPIFGILFVAIIIVICVKQCVSKIDYDLSVTVYTSTPVSDDDCKAIGSYFEEYGDDINGDGEVHIKVNNCSYADGGNPQIILANNTKLQAIIAAEYDAILFITDDKTREYIQNINSSVSLLEGEGVVLNEDFYNKCNVDDYLKLPENLRISRRIVSNTSMQNNKEAKQCYELAYKILDKISQ